MGVIMKNFVYLKASSIENAISALKEHEDAHLLAGGTDLLVGMKNKTIEPKHIIDIKGIPKIDSIEYEEGVKIGPLTTIREIEVSKVLRTSSSQPWFDPSKKPGNHRW
jgi:carbon-monoxide dehydrogenase medium subunit